MVKEIPGLAKSSSLTLDPRLPALGTPRGFDTGRPTHSGTARDVARVQGVFVPLCHDGDFRIRLAVQSGLAREKGTLKGREEGEGSRG